MIVNPSSVAASHWLIRVGGLLDAIRKPDPTPAEPVPREELRRLAETSPHLLEDIGFLRAREPGTWVRSDYRVTISRRPPASP